jgi:hypothetical protein
VFYHNDADGIIGAALFLHNTIGHAKTADYVLHPVQSQSRDSIDEKVKAARSHRDERVVIIDYQYSPHADLVIDHHYSSFLGDKFIKNDKLIYDPKAKSCVQVIYDHIMNYKCRSSFNDDGVIPSEGGIKEVVEIANMIDSAQYPDNKFFFESDHPAMILNHYISAQPFNANVYNRIVELLWKNCLDVERTLYTLNINTKAILKSIQDSAKSFEKNLVKNNDFSIAFIKRKNQFPRYAEFYINNDIRYTIRSFPISGDRCQVQFGYNEFHEKSNTFNIGLYASNKERSGEVISGGGHFNIGSVIIETSKRDEYIDELIATINNHNYGEKCDG